MTQKLIIITDQLAPTFVLPSDFSHVNTVECYGAGQNGTWGQPGPVPITAQQFASQNGASGAGGYYSVASNFSWNAGQTIWINVGIPGGRGSDTWVNGVSNAAPTSTAQGVLAPGGGSSSSPVGTVTHAGGSGVGVNQTHSPGGGGAGGPSGVGENGHAFGNGGAANGMTGSATGCTLNAPADSGLGGGAKISGAGQTWIGDGAGADHAIYNETSGIGPGGGGGGSGGSPGHGGGGGAGTGAPSNFGSNGAIGGAGFIAITYTTLTLIFHPRTGAVMT